MSIFLKKVPTNPRLPYWSFVCVLKTAYVDV